MREEMLSRYLRRNLLLLTRQFGKVSRFIRYKKKLAWIDILLRIKKKWKLLNNIDLLCSAESTLLTETINSILMQ